MPRSRVVFTSSGGGTAGLNPFTTNLTLKPFLSIDLFDLSLPSQFGSL